jgi:hypothetical protein
MSILTSNDLARIDRLLAAAADEGQAVQAIRREFPDVTLTRCDASDVDGEEPFRRYLGFNLHLIDGVDHCWRLTSDPTRVTGIVLARKRGAA